MKLWITQLRKGLLEFCVMNLLAHGETYGYALTQRLKAFEELAVTESTLYPILTRLREEGLLKVRVEASAGNRERRYFSLTLLGQQRVREMDGYWDQLQAVIQQLRDGTLPRGGSDGIKS